VILCLLTADDAEEMAIVLQDPGLYEYIGGHPPTLPELKERFRVWERRRSLDGSEEWLNWIVRLAESGEAVGYVQATIAKGEAVIAYVTGPSWQKEGLTKDAVETLVEALFCDLEVSTIRAHISPGNVASQHIAKAAGLRPTSENDSDGEQIWSETRSEFEQALDRSGARNSESPFRTQR
jgi:RimJ/RimL family protein N-acetyltransferase